MVSKERRTVAMKLYHGTNVNFELIRDKENELHIQSSAYNYEL